MAYIFDELVFDATAPTDIVREAFEQLEETCGYAFKLTEPPVQPLVAHLLIANGRGRQGDVLPRWDGDQQCLYDAVRYLSTHCPDPPLDGPHTVRDFNNGCGHSSQRGTEALWLEEIVGLTAQQVLARHHNVICWQPYDAEQGHFFAVSMLEEQMVCLRDSSVGASVSTQAHHFFIAQSRVGNCVFFEAKWLDVASLPSMDGASYDLQGGAGMRQRRGSAFPAPKKGKRRMYAKFLKISKPKWRKLYKTTPYVRHRAADAIRRPERVKWSASLKTIQGATDLQLVKTLTRAGFLKDWSASTCPHCGEGRVSSLVCRKQGERSLWSYRCRKYGCHKFISPHHSHPIFSNAWGCDFVPLKEQAEMLFCLVLGIKNTHTRRLLGSGETFTRTMCSRLDLCRKKFVEHKQKLITFGLGDPKTYFDVEADEVDLGKSLVGGSSSRVVWSQWAGVVQRGHPQSLYLFKTTPKTTKQRAPGPGPIKKRDWSPVCRKLLLGRYVFLHTDGARAYKLSRKFKGVIHDYVVHRKKKVGGRWKKPKYAQLFLHELPDGTKVACKGGTQIIDRAWSSLRKHLGQRAKNPGSSALDARVRSAQWLIWHRDKDLWAATGQLCEWLHS